MLIGDSPRRTVGTMRRSDWLILFLQATPGGPLDPVRVQKGMFLLTMRASLEEAQCYAFEPYAYGPMSRVLYGDVRLLCREHILDSTPIEGAAWQLLGLGASGRLVAERLRLEAARHHPDTLTELESIRREISGLSFSELLEHVYDCYPAYAIRSVFRRAR